MSNTSLSICIATRNRATLIGATLESIICQATEQVEIVVLDGASTDNTGEVVRRYQESFPRLRYFRQDMNMGIDNDFANAVGLAEGEYCWLFSDDDLLKPGAIQTVLNAIKGEYGLIIPNAEVRNADLSKLLQPQRLPLVKDRVYKPSEGSLLLADVAYYLTFIGCVIIKRELWDAREKKKYFGSFFVHVGVIFQSPLPDDTLVIAKPLISIRYGNAMWFSKCFEMWMFKWPELIWSFTGYPDSVKLQVCSREPWRKAKSLLQNRAQGTYSIEEYREWLEALPKSAWTRAISKGIAYLPGRIANLLAVVYWSIICRRSDRRVRLLDLSNSRYCVWKSTKQRPQAKGQPVVKYSGDSIE